MPRLRSTTTRIGAYTRPEEVHARHILFKTSRPGPTTRQGGGAQAGRRGARQGQGGRGLRGTGEAVLGRRLAARAVIWERDAGQDGEAVRGCRLRAGTRHHQRTRESPFGLHIIKVDAARRPRRSRSTRCARTSSSCCGSRRRMKRHKRKRYRTKRKLPAASRSPTWRQRRAEQSLRHRPSGVDGSDRRPGTRRGDPHHYRPDAGRPDGSGGENPEGLRGVPVPRKDRVACAGAGGHPPTGGNRTTNRAGRGGGQDQGRGGADGSAIRDD